MRYAIALFCVATLLAACHRAEPQPQQPQQPTVPSTPYPPADNDDTYVPMNYYY